MRGAALSALMHAEGIVLDAALVGQIERDKQELTARGNELNINSWKRQHAKSSSGVKGGGGVSSLAAVPASSKPNMHAKLQFTQQPPPDVSYNVDRYDGEPAAEPSRTHGVLQLRPPNQLEFCGSGGTVLQPRGGSHNPYVNQYFHAPALVAPPPADAAAAAEAQPFSALCAAAGQGAITLTGQGPFQPPPPKPPPLPSNEHLPVWQANPKDDAPGFWVRPSSYVGEGGHAPVQTQVAEVARRVAAAMTLAKEDVKRVRQEERAAKAPKVKPSKRAMEMSEVLATQRDLQDQNQRLELQLRQQALLLQRLATMQADEKRNRATTTGPAAAAAAASKEGRGTAGQAFCAAVAQQDGVLRDVHTARDLQAHRAAATAATARPHRPTAKSAAIHHHHRVYDTAVKELLVAAEGTASGTDLAKILERMSKAQAMAEVGPPVQPRPVKRELAATHVAATRGGSSDRGTNRGRREWNDRPPSPPRREPRSLLQRSEARKSCKRKTPQEAEMRRVAAMLVEKDVARGAATSPDELVTDALGSLQSKLTNLIQATEEHIEKRLGEMTFKANQMRASTSHAATPQGPATRTLKETGTSPVAVPPQPPPTTIPATMDLGEMAPAVYTCLEKLQELEASEARLAQRWLTPQEKDVPPELFGAHGTSSEVLRAETESLLPETHEANLRAPLPKLPDHKPYVCKYVERSGDDCGESATTTNPLAGGGGLDRMLSDLANGGVAAAARAGAAARDKLAELQDARRIEGERDVALLRQSATVQSELAKWRPKGHLTAGIASALPPQPEGAYYAAAVSDAMVQRVLAGRKRFLRTQALLDGALVSASRQDGDEEGFDPVKVVETVSDALVGEVVDASLNELVGMMDTFVDKVVEHELA